MSRTQKDIAVARARWLHRALLKSRQREALAVRREFDMSVALSEEKERSKKGDELLTGAVNECMKLKKELQHAAEILCELRRENASVKHLKALLVIEWEKEGHAKAH